MNQKALDISGEEHIADAAEHGAEYVRKHHRKESHRHHHRNRHRNHQQHDQQRQSRSTVEEDRIDIYNVQQQQLKQSSRPVKTGPPTKPKPNVALSRKSASKNNWLIYFLANDNLRFV